MQARAVPMYGSAIVDRTRLMSARDVAQMTGMSYERALALLKIRGVTLGQARRYITMDRLQEALKEGF